MLMVQFQRIWKVCIDAQVTLDHATHNPKFRDENSKNIVVKFHHLEEDVFLFWKQTGHVQVPSLSF